jgi:hypothetical protein
MMTTKALEGDWRSEGGKSGEGWEGYINHNGFYEGAGTVDGHPWYLHARGWRWAVAIASANEDPVNVVFGEIPGYYHEERHPDPAAMTCEEVWACVQKCLEEFRQVGFNVEAGSVHDPVLRAFDTIER